MVGQEPLRRVYRQFQNGTEGSGPSRNSNVSNILPVTTLRTIDLESKKKPDSLFSRFCGELRVFFQRNAAPKKVQSKTKFSGKLGSRRQAAIETGA
jgi:hypothetical protein